MRLWIIYYNIYLSSSLYIYKIIIYTYFFWLSCCSTYIELRGVLNDKNVVVLCLITLNIIVMIIFLLHMSWHFYRRQLALLGSFSTCKWLDFFCAWFFPSLGCSVHFNRLTPMISTPPPSYRIQTYILNDYDTTLRLHWSLSQLLIISYTYSSCFPVE